MITLKDSDGNRIYTSEDRVYLKLKDKRTRLLGRVNKQKDGSLQYRKYIKGVDIIKANKSIGLCYDLITHLGENGNIHLTVENQGNLKLKAKAALDIGNRKENKILYSKTQGFEKQIFIPLKNWEY